MAAKDHMTPEEIARSPEHAKLYDLNDANEIVGEFLDWLIDQRKVDLCQWQDAGHNGEPRIIYSADRPPEAEIDEWGHRAGRWYRDNPEYESWHQGYVRIGTSRQQLIAQYFGIDLAALDREKRALLARIRAAATNGDA